MGPEYTIEISFNAVYDEDGNTLKEYGDIDLGSYFDESSN